VITSVDPETMRRSGGSFLIVGGQLYPNIVSDVLLNGNAFPSANVVPLDDSHVRVAVPSSVRRD
jgi:hypothetical protein